MVKLAGETLSGHWVDVAIELHLVACRPLREETIQQLAALRAKAPSETALSLWDYHERLRGPVAHGEHQAHSLRARRVSIARARHQLRYLGT